MAEPRMLPGERMEATLRPHPLSWLGRYLLGGFPLLWGLFLAGLWRTEWWNSAASGAWYEVWTWLYGNTGAAYVYTIVRKERQLKFEAITDLDGSQGPLGSLFDYGTLIPVTQSGFGLGNDTSQAGVAVGGGGSKGGLFGGAAVMAGGGKEVSVGRARTFHQLTGVRPYKDIKYLLERLIQEATSTPYLREQVELQRQMVDTLRQMQGGGELAFDATSRNP